MGVKSFAPDISMSISFQTQSMPLLHMAVSIMPTLRIFFLDTGYHFWATLIFREKIQHAWNLNIVELYCDPRWDIFTRQHPRILPVQDLNLCRYIHKVKPAQKASSGSCVWISGIRHDQTVERSQAKILDLQDDGSLKVNPLLNWTKRDVQVIWKNTICQRIHCMNAAI